MRKWLPAAALLLASPALAQQAPCAPVDAILKALEDNAKEVPAGMGRDERGFVSVLTLSPDGSYSVQPTHGDLDRSIGRLDGIIGQMLEFRKQRDEHVDDRLARIEAKIEAIGDTLASAKGGGKVLLIIGGIAGMVGGWIVPTFVKRLMGW